MRYNFRAWWAPEALVPTVVSTRKVLTLSLATLIGLNLAACSRSTNPTPIVVHVLRDPAAHEADAALSTLAQQELRSPTNRPIVIATIEGRSYEQLLKLVSQQGWAEVLILNSPADARSFEPAAPEPIQLEGRQLFVVVSSSSKGEERNAAIQLVAALHSSAIDRH
jgi:hypothetical protein